MKDLQSQNFCSVRHLVMLEDMEMLKDGFLPFESTRRVAMSFFVPLSLLVEKQFHTYLKDLLASLVWDLL